MVHGLTLDELLAGRGVVDAAVSGLVTPQAAEMGLLLHSVTIKDLMLPTDLKRVYAEVLRAQKEGQATLERARGETAALRSLANAARLLEEQPMLLQLRWMQVVNGSSGNTVVVGSADPATAGKQAKKQKD